MARPRVPDAIASRRSFAGWRLSNTMVICDRQGEQLLLTLSPEGVRFLREQWSWLRELVRWQLAGCTDDPLAEVTGLPVPIGTIDGRLAYVVDYWCGTQETGLVRKLWEGWVLHDLEHSLTRVKGAKRRSNPERRLAQLLVCFAIARNDSAKRSPALRIGRSCRCDRRKLRV